MLQLTSPEIPQNLGCVLLGKGSDCLQLDNKFVGDNQVGGKVTQQTAIFIVDAKRNLLIHLQLFLPETVSQRIFTNLLRMTVPQEAVSFKCSLADGICELEGGGLVHFFAGFVLFVVRK